MRRVFDKSWHWVLQTLPEKSDRIICQFPLLGGEGQGEGERFSIDQPADNPVGILRTHWLQTKRVCTASSHSKTARAGECKTRPTAQRRRESHCDSPRQHRRKSASDALL